MQPCSFHKCFMSFGDSNTYFRLQMCKLILRGLKTNARFLFFLLFFFMKLTSLEFMNNCILIENSVSSVESKFV